MVVAGIFCAPATAAPPTAPPPASAPPVDAQTQIDTLGATSFPGLYGGYSVAGDNTITVYLTSLNATVEQAFIDKAAGAPLNFQSTPNALSTLNALTDTLQSLWTSLVASGIKLFEFGPNAETGKLDIGVVKLTPIATQSLGNLLGATNINVYNVADPTNAGAQLDYSRTDDIAPYYAGDAITNAAETGGCTSGWGININGNPRLLTAGHCWAVGSNIVNQKFTSTGVMGSGNAMGSVTDRAYFDSSPLDAEVFTGCNGAGECGGTSQLWIGSATSPTLRFVGGIGSWGHGTQVCVSGPYGGTECDLTVAKANYCTTLAGKYLCHVTMTTGTNLPVSGDSGAPAYRLNGPDDVLAVGTHTAHNDNGDEWFTGINAELDRFGATLITN